MDPVALTAIIAQVGAIIAATLLIGHLLGTIVGRAVSRGGSLAAKHAHRLTEVSIWLAGAAFGADYFGLRIDVLLVVIALAGTAVIVANKDALQNLAARYFSDVYLQFRVGDTIRVAEYLGRIIDLNPVTTLLLTQQEEVISVPNSLLVREIVVNKTPFAGRDVTIPITVEKGIDIPTFEKMVLMSCNKLRLHLDERSPPRITVEKENEKSAELNLMVRLKVPEKRDMVVRELEQRISKLLEGSKKEKKLLAPLQQV